jgi:hypothetical protein
MCRLLHHKRFHLEHGGYGFGLPVDIGLLTEAYTVIGHGKKPLRQIP